MFPFFPVIWKYSTFYAIFEYFEKRSIVSSLNCGKSKKKKKVETNIIVEVNIYVEIVLIVTRIVVAIVINVGHQVI